MVLFSIFRSNIHSLLKSANSNSLVRRQSVLSPVNGSVILAVHVLEHRVLQGGGTRVRLGLLCIEIGEPFFSDHAFVVVSVLLLMRELIHKIRKITIIEKGTKEQRSSKTEVTKSELIKFKHTSNGEVLKLTMAHIQNSMLRASWGMLFMKDILVRASVGMAWV